MNKKNIYIVISGVCLALSLPPFSMWPLAFISLVPFYFTLDGATKKQSFYYGWGFGFVFFVSTLYWVMHSMYFYGGIPLFLGFPLMLLLSLGLGLYFALYGYFYSYGVGLNETRRMLFGASLWVVFEYLRAILLTGFPWVLVGYSQKPFLYFTQVADITGVYGISFAVVLVNIALYFFIHYERGELSFASVKKSSLAVIVFLLIVVYGVIRINIVDSEVSSWKKINASVVQGNIDQAVKWDPAFKDETVDIYRRLTDQASKDGSELVIWPEVATPFLLESTRDETLSYKVRGSAIENDINLITGSLHSRRESSGKVSYLNSAFVINNKGLTIDRYDKVHLVPLGEYVPLRLNEIFPFIQKLTVGVGDFGEGTDSKPLTFITKDGSVEGVGVSICYEVIFPELSRRSVLEGATLLATITNDAWFGRWSAPYQHFEMASFRAIESRAYLLRSANTGISGVIDPVGRVLAKSELFEESVITTAVGLKSGSKTFYTLYGDLFSYLCIMMVVVFLLRRNK